MNREGNSILCINFNSWINHSSLKHSRYKNTVTVEWNHTKRKGK